MRRFVVHRLPANESSRKCGNGSRRIATNRTESRRFAALNRINKSSANKKPAIFSCSVRENDPFISVDTVTALFRVPRHWQRSFRSLIGGQQGVWPMSSGIGFQTQAMAFSLSAVSLSIPIDRFEVVYFWKLSFFPGYIWNILTEAFHQC